MQYLSGMEILLGPITAERGLAWSFDFGMARRAVQMVRSNAETWGVDPNVVGVIGFSAGGHLAAMLATTWDSDHFALVQQDSEVKRMVTRYRYYRRALTFASLPTQLSLQPMQSFGTTALSRQYLVIKRWGITAPCRMCRPTCL